MPAKPRSWRQKIDLRRDVKKVVLEAPFAGIPAGSRLFVATPRVVEEYIGSIPRGESRSLVRLRRELARRHGCDATCPVSTSIFVRMVAEAAWEAIQSGAKPTAVAPFWRVVEPGSAIARRSSVDADWLLRRREEEGLTTAATAAPPRGASVGRRRTRSPAAS